MIKQTATALVALMLCLPAVSETPANTEANVLSTSRKVVETFDFTKQGPKGAILNSTIDKVTALKDASNTEVTSNNNIIQHMDFTKNDPLAAVDYGITTTSEQEELSDTAASTSRAIAKATTYTVRGRRYQTLADSSGFTQEGRASWYGPGFHGRKTANGEIYDMNAMTAAHKRLPLGSRVKVTNLANGKSVIVRINDRGPFHGDRILDLSKAAAKQLGVIRSGTAQVEIQALK